MAEDKAVPNDAIEERGVVSEVIVPIAGMTAGGLAGGAAQAAVSHALQNRPPRNPPPPDPPSIELPPGVNLDE